MDLHYIYICAALECNYLIWLFKLFKHWCATAQKMQATVWSISDEFVLVSSFVIFGLFWPISHCDPPSYCYHFTAFKNKVKHFILTVGLCQTPHITKVKRKCFLFVFVLGKVVATQRWFMWHEGSTRVRSLSLSGILPPGPLKCPKFP